MFCSSIRIECIYFTNFDRFMLGISKGSQIPEVVARRCSLKNVLSKIPLFK